MELWMFRIKLIIIVLVALVLIILARRRRAISIKLAGVMAFALLCFAAWSFFDQQGRNSGLQPSPDGKYVARVMIAGGMLDGSDSTVIVRRKGRLIWHRAYKGYGYMQNDEPDYPRPEWKDSRHLILYYHGAPSDPPNCPSRVDEVWIECRAENW